MSQAYDSVFHVPEGGMTEEEIEKKVSLTLNPSPNLHPHLPSP